MVRIHRPRSVHRPVLPDSLRHNAECRPSSAHLSPPGAVVLVFRLPRRDHAAADDHGHPGHGRRPLCRSVGPGSGRTLGRAHGRFSGRRLPQHVASQRHPDVGDAGHADHGSHPAGHRPPPATPHLGQRRPSRPRLRRRGPRPGRAHTFHPLPLASGRPGRPPGLAPPEVRPPRSRRARFARRHGPVGGAEPGHLQGPDLHLDRGRTGAARGQLQTDLLRSLPRFLGPRLCHFGSGQGRRVGPGRSRPDQGHLLHQASREPSRRGGGGPGRTIVGRLPTGPDGRRRRQRRSTP